MSFEFWDKKRNKIISTVGGWKIGEAVYVYNYSLLDDIVGNKSYFQLLTLYVTGKLPDIKFSKWLEGIFSCLSFPDPRIWCNQIGALGGTCKASAISSITSGIQASESVMYGPGTAEPVINFLYRAMEKKNHGEAITSIVDEYARRPGLKPEIPGYGRPIATGDERVFTMKKYSGRLGFSDGVYMQLANEIEEHLELNYELKMNFAMYIVAFLCDQNWTLAQIKQGTALIVAAGVTACYIDTSNNYPESFLPLRCEDIKYTGPSPRQIPIT